MAAAASTYRAQALGLTTMAARGPTGLALAMGISPIWTAASATPP